MVVSSDVRVKQQFHGKRWKLLMGTPFVDGQGEEDFCNFLKSKLILVYPER